MHYNVNKDDFLYYITFDCLRPRRLDNDGHDLVPGSPDPVLEPDHERASEQRSTKRASDDEQSDPRSRFSRHDDDGHQTHRDGRDDVGPSRPRTAPRREGSEPDARKQQQRKDGLVRFESTREHGRPGERGRQADRRSIDGRRVRRTAAACAAVVDGSVGTRSRVLKGDGSRTRSIVAEQKADGQQDSRQSPD